MGFKLELPDIGEGVVEAEVQKWFVAPGDVVHEDQPLVEVMTDKATVVIPSPKRGRVVTLFWKEGEVAKVHAPLVELELEAAPAAAPRPAATAAPGAPATPPASARPDFGAGPAARAGAAATGGQGAPAAKALATPAVRAMARELGVDLNGIAGTGPGGRVTKDDLARARDGRNGHARAEQPPHVPGPAPEPAPPTPNPPPTQWPTAATPRASPIALAPAAPRAAGPAPAAVPPPSAGAPPGADEERIPIRGIRKRIAENMARSKRTAAHFTFVEQADVSELVRTKDRMAAAAREEGVKLTFLPFVVKAAVAALRKFPRLSASLDEERQEIVLKRRYDLGIASATEQGLVVPVVRGVDRRSLLDVAREIERLGADAKAGRLRPEDVGHSTFTITSLGALGGLFATPVINHPEVAILGLHRIRPTPVVRDGQIVVRDVMHVSLTSDHRVVDGHEAAAFTYEVIRALEDPALLFMRMA
jgi:pyruvate dehydrogenase E2 component (dihydrolipoamide acetyltransferase)